MGITYGSNEDWAEQIRRFRRDRMIKQMALAEMIGVDQATVSRWESGRVIPPLAWQRRLRDLIARRAAGDALLRHWIETAVNSLVLSDATHSIVAASSAYEKGHGLEPGTAAGRSTLPTYTSESLAIRLAAGEHGFLRGEVASVSIVARGNSHCGRRRNIPLKVVWTPVRQDDGQILIRSERLELNETEFAAAQASNGDTARFVMMDQLAS